MENHTIYAFATGEGISAVAILRVSGTACRNILLSCVGDIPEPRIALLRKIYWPGRVRLVDRGIVLWFPGPGSFTGEDCIEFHVHGSLATRIALMDAIGSLDGCRPAEAGEFTRRAFMNGKMDLEGVEALADILHAKTDRQRQQALEGMEGRIGRQAEDWRSGVLGAMSLVEASIDFVDEDDSPEDVGFEVEVLLGEVRAKISEALEAVAEGEVVREGFKVAICGPPNAGKSSLLNVLAGRDAAIVSEFAGTTRDVIEVSLDMGGLLVRVSDTAGIRPSEDFVEQIGVSKALDRANDADLVLWLQPGSDVCHVYPGFGASLAIVRIATKCDLFGERFQGRGFDFGISVSDSFGIEALVGCIRERALAAAGGGQGVVFLRERHAHLARSALKVLDEVSANPGRFEAEILAEKLREVSRLIGGISGFIDTEEVLGEIFSRFCMGK